MHPGPSVRTLRCADVKVQGGEGARGKSKTPPRNRSSPTLLAAGQAGPGNTPRPRLRRRSLSRPTSHRDALGLSRRRTRMLADPCHNGEKTGRGADPRRPLERNLGSGSGRGVPGLHGHPPRRPVPVRQRERRAASRPEPPAGTGRTRHHGPFVHGTGRCGETVKTRRSLEHMCGGHVGGAGGTPLRLQGFTSFKNPKHICKIVTSV